MEVLGIVGTRNPKIPFEEFCKFLKGYNPDLIVSGGAKGIDSYAEEYARMKAIPVKIFLPEYSKYGKSATFIRNQQIIDSATRLIAFPSIESKGTYDSIRRAERSNKEIKIIQI